MELGGLRLWTAVAGASVLFASALSAQTMRGPGARPCSEWSLARRDGGHAYEAEAWVLGYISGSNAAAGRGAVNIFSKADNPTIFGELDAYCRDHPANSIWEAVKQLVPARHNS
jgi:hypothetical protein